ncbi:MAG: response regulator [Lachnospiraceae bacterium]|nr:response regulator [Lachnospiraceae bacterium]
MIKVFLAEDEFVVREGIKNKIDWTAHGCEFCGEAGDGELAWSLIQKEQPDIVITDIKMPFMDGLVLARHIKADFPQTEIILLTGYEEFEYAQEAVRIGVARYLSKPISSENLIREVDAISEKILEKREERESARKYAEEMRERNELEKQEFFRNLVTGGRELSEILDDAKRLGIDIAAICYNVMLFRVWHPNDRGVETYSERRIDIDRDTRRIADEEGAIVFDRYLEGEAFLFKADGEAELKDALGRAKERITGLLAGRNVRYFGGIGEMVNRITDLPRSYAEASRAFAGRYFTENNEFLTSRSGEPVRERADFRLAEVDPRRVDKRQLQEFLYRGDPAETDYFLETFFEGLGKNALQSTMFRQYILMDSYFCLADFTENELHRERDEVELPDASGAGVADAQGAKDYISRIVRHALTLREETSSGRYREAVHEAIRYIEENYAQEDLTLNRLAAHVNFSPNHLSTIFRQETGQPFIRYLTDYRMDKARELLRLTAKKSSEISVLCGYRDPHYFSYLFKKTQGMTPTQFRESGMAEGHE